MNKYFLIVLFYLYISSKSEGTSSNQRLTFKEIIDEENTFYLLDTKQEYKEIKNLIMNDTYTNSSTYSYEWSNHPKRAGFNLNNYLPPGDSDGYRDFTKYDTLYINMYSKRMVDTKIIIIIGCQKRQPDETSDMPYAYKNYKIPINFVGWKQIKLNLQIFEDGYAADLTKVSRFEVTSNGYGQTPRVETELFFDKIFVTKLKYEFNMKESEINEENYSNVFKRIKYFFLGSANIIKETDKTILKRLKLEISGGVSWYKKLNKTGLPFDYPMNSTRDMTAIYYYLNRIARAYIIEGSEYYKNKTVLNDLINALEYMDKNYFSKRYPKVILGFDQFWDWEIGVPHNLIETLSHIKDDLTKEQIDKFLTTLNKYTFYPKNTMANKADIAYSAIMAGILQKDYKRVAISVEMLRDLYENVEIGEGFYEDGSFIQHDVFAYTGGYGVEFIDSLSKLSYILDDSCFRLDDDMKEKQYNWVINSYIPLLFNGAFMDLVRGRSVDTKFIGLATGTTIMGVFTYISEYTTNPTNIKYLKTYLKYMYKYVNENYQNYYLNQISIGALIMLFNIISDESIPYENINKNFTKVYSRMDKAIAQINGIGIGISLSSTRIGKYEASGENKKGWYQGDGMTYLYFSPNDYASAYWPYVNPYRLPGTTITNAQREQKTLSGRNAYAKYDFVGGCYNDINMVVAMKFASELPAHNFKSSLIGNKAYFIFGDNLIFIGNNISCDDNYDVETIIENKLLNGSFYFGDQKITEKSGNVNNNYIYIENYGGIYLPDYSNVKYQVTKNQFLEIYFSHGKKIENERYMYYIFPGIDKNNLKNYVNNIEILIDTINITAVKSKLNGVVEYVFWEKGSFDKIEVDNPCTIILYENEFYISDPSQKLDNIKVKINNNNYNIELQKGYTYKYKLNNKSKIINSSIYKIMIFIFVAFLF